MCSYSPETCIHEIRKINKNIYKIKKQEKKCFQSIRGVKIQPLHIKSGTVNTWSRLLEGGYVVAPQ